MSKTDVVVDVEPSSLATSDAGSAGGVTTANDDHERSAEEAQRWFLNAIRQCQVQAVEEFLDGHRDFDVNCKNYQGMTGLNVAIEVDCADAVDVLLSLPRLDIGDGLMHAIRYDRYAIVVKLLNILESRDDRAARSGCKDSSDFPEHVTPLMLAAQCGHFKIITLLLKRGHEIAVPHKARCLCKEVCKSDKQMNNGLGAADLKIAAFRALTNPAYISLTSEDPVLTAFHLSKELKEHGTVDRVFRSDYEQLDEQTRLFAVHLIGLCRTAAEVDTVLTRREGCTFFGAFPYHRLVLAMDLKQKEFVAHAYVQQALELSWTGDWYRWRRAGTAYKSTVVVPRIALLPYIALLYLVFPYSKAGRHYVLPVNRMLNYMASYAVFLAVLSCENNAAKRRATDHQPGWTLKCAILVYVLSFAYRTAKLALVQGPRRYFGMLWNVYDCVTLATFAATFACWWLSYRDWPAAAAAAVPRELWPATDPELVAEGLLAVATVMAWLRVLFLCQLSYALGPMQVSLGKMTTDFARFALLFGIVLLAFTAGLCTLFQYYEGMARTEPGTGREYKQDESFVSVAATLKTLFWGLFCMSPATAGSVVIEATVADYSQEEAVANNHYFTQAVGTALYAGFMVLSVVIMMNMLVASMTNTYQRVTGNSYVEWVFGRTKVFLSFSVHTELPPPMNLIPSSQCCLELCGCLGNCCKASAVGFARLISSKGFRSKPETKENFKALMTLLIRRYFRDRLSTGFDRKCNPVCG